MAKTEDINKELAKPNSQLMQGERLNQLLEKIDIRKKFEDMLGARAAGFLSSIQSAVSTNPALKVCNPMSVISSAAIAATLDLPINASLGFAALVPYRNKEGEQIAQFQMMAKGFIQLAIRTGQYETMNVSEVYEDEIDVWNPITGEIKFTPIEEWKFRDDGKLEKIVGYVAFFKLVNGFRKYLYMTTKQVDAHGKKYSKAYNMNFSLWQKDPHVMRLKTVIKLLLSKYGLMSIEMQKAVEFDQGVAKNLPNKSEAIEVTYPDAPVDGEPAEDPNGTAVEP